MGPTMKARAVHGEHALAETNLKKDYEAKVLKFPPNTEHLI